MPRLRMKLIGAPSIELDGAPIPIERQKTLALLAYLAVTNQEHHREPLAALLWPETPQDRAFANLRRALWELNNYLGDGWLTTGRETAGLVDTPELWVDVHQYRALLKRVQNHNHSNGEDCLECAGWLEGAASLYQGEFLSGFTLKDAPEFDNWRFFLAEELRNSQISTLKRLVSWHEGRQELNLALEYGRKWVFIDSLDEEAHRSLMRLYTLTGQRSAALHQFEECQRILREELDISPQLETQQLYERIRSGQLNAPTKMSAPASLPEPDKPEFVRFSNLPARGTPFIGREAELAEIIRLLLDPGCRLLTLLGPGGIGKTRLAMQAAEEMAQLPQVRGFSDGIFYIPLFHLTASDSLVPAISLGLGLSLNTDERIAAALTDPKSQLLDFLRQRQALLVLDNFEHLVEQSSVLSEILSAAKGVSLLVTSRQRLALQEEWALEVHGMSYPPSECDLEGADFDQFTAPILFVEAARRTRVDFSLSEAERPCLAQICRLVDGFPLGLELAAAWTRMLSPCEIAQEISSGLDFLETPLRNVPERHRSLRAVFEHSWNLLTPQEQQVYRKLSIFQGGFSRKAAIEVTGATLARLSSLADKSLIQVEGTTSCQTSDCCDLHVQLKQFAFEKLEASPEEKQDVQTRYAQYYCRFLADVWTQLKGSQNLAGIAEIRSEIDNLRQAWRYANETGLVEQVMQACLPLTLYYNQTGQYLEGRQMFGLAVDALRQFYLSAPGNRDLASCLSFILITQAHFLAWPEYFNKSVDLQKESLEILPAQRRGLDWVTLGLHIRNYSGLLSPERAEQFFSEVLQEAASTHDDWLLAATHEFWGDYKDASNADMLERIEPRLKALEIYRRIGNKPGMASCLTGLAHFSYLAGQYKASLEYAQQAYEIDISLQDDWKAALTLLTLGQLAVADGDYQGAHERYLESLKLYRNLGARVMIAVMLDSTGFTELHLGNLDSAEQRFIESHALYQQVGHQVGVAMSLINLGDVSLARGDRSQATERYETALKMVQDQEILWEKMVCLRKLGTLAAERGDFHTARSNYRQALWIATKETRTPEILDILVRYADLYAREGALQKAVPVLDLCQDNPAITQETKAEIDRLRDISGNIRSEDERLVSIEQVVKELLD